MRLARWFVGGAVIALILVLAVAVWMDRSATVQVVVSTDTTRDIRVQVSGAVATPGVVEVPGDARLIDVVNAAGGFTDAADVTALNLAGRVGDGEQILIPVLGETPPGGTGVAAQSSLLNLNTATAAQLDGLPGIGPVLAGRIVEYRDQHGPFTSVDELANVQGISPRLVEDLRPLVIVDENG